MLHIFPAFHIIPFPCLAARLELLLKYPFTQKPTMRSQVPKSRSRKRECISSEEEEKACALRRKKQRRTITRSESREVPISDSDEETPAEHTTLRPNRKDHNPSMLLVERRQLSLITDHDFSAFFDLGAGRTHDWCWKSPAELTPTE